MTSLIDPTVPVTGAPTTASVRANFATAKQEISDLQVRANGAPFLSLSGGTMTGPMVLANDPTTSMSPVTLGYFQSHGGGGGSGGIADAPVDGTLYARQDASWKHAVNTAELNAAISAAIGGVPPEAPNDGVLYGRRSRAWSAAVDTAQLNAAIAAAAYADAPNDGKPYLRLGGAWKFGIPQLGAASDMAVVENTTGANKTPTLAGNLTPVNPTSDGLKLYARRLTTPASNTSNADGAAIALNGPTVPTLANMIQLFAGNNTAGYVNWNFQPDGQIVAPGQITVNLPATADNGLQINAASGHYARALYNVASARLWSAGVAPSGSFTIADETGSAVRLTFTNAGVGTINAKTTFVATGDPVTLQSNNGQNAYLWSTVTGTKTHCIGSAFDGSFRILDQTNSAYRLTIDTNGISTFPLAVHVGSGGIFYDDVGLTHYYRIRWDGTGLYIMVDAVYMQVTIASQRSLKSDIEPTTVDALADLRSVPLYSYMQDMGPSSDPVPTRFDCGWIAEDLEAIIPEAVTHIDVPGDEPRLVPIWQPILGRAVRAMQQLADQVDALTARVAALEGG